MDTTLLIGALLALAVLFVALPVGRHVYRRLRGPRVIICPETKEPTAVEIDAGFAAVSAVLRGKPEFRIARCDRWLEGHTCDEACLRGMDEETIARHGIIPHRRVAAP